MTVEGLKSYGLAEMSDGQIRDFLANEGMGVLGLPAAEVPYLLPMAFGYDGDRRLYFSFFFGNGSRKRELSGRTDQASFLVYHADSPYFWESVTLTGSLREVPESEWADHEAALDNAWHLDLFEQVDGPGEMQLYEFFVEDQRGLKYTGLPPGLREAVPDETA
jgi:nitroimidazol reductase NimA-like FMN-containing flavoprotein (pyridoxamine 5'-phosphate oxidase superfamily)